MSLLDVYAESAGAAYDRQLRNPPPDVEPEFSVVSMTGAGLKGFPSAALERSGTVSDILSAFGTAAASADSRAGGMFSLPTPEEQKQQEEARQRMLRGEAFDTGPGNVLRRKAQEFSPDPQTSHTADQVLHGLVRFGAKAVTDVATMGPAGALVTGAEEANTVTQNLRMEGVDTATAAKVGAVQGGMAAAGVVLPLVGKTIMQTLGLVAVGGPGSYVAQEALSRRILEEAGYNDQASLHNPFDPLGLAVSTVILGGFGAVHGVRLRQRGQALEAGTLPITQLRPEELRALRYDDKRLDDFASATAEKYGVPPALLLAIKNAGEKSGPTATSPKGARGVMQFMPGTAKEMGLADPTDPLASIDAGARYLKKLFDAYGSWDAAVAHYNGGGAQAAIVRGGGQPTYNETRGYLERVRKYVQEHTAESAAKSPEAVDAARVVVMNETVARSLPDTPDAMAQVQRAADIVAERGGRAAEAEIAPVPEPRPFIEAVVEDSEGRQVPGLRVEFDNQHGGQGVMELAIREDEGGGRLHVTWVDNAMYGRGEQSSGGVVTKLYEQAIEEADARGLRFTSDDSVTEPAVRVYEALERRGYEVVRNPNARLATRPEVVSPRWLTDDGSPVFEVKGRPAKVEVAQPARPADNALPPADSVTLAGDQPAKPGAELTAAPAKGGTEGSALPDANGSASRGTDRPAATLDAQIAQKLATEQPELQVVLPGTDTPISVKEALARIAEEQKQDGEWADLVKVAAECALTAG